MPKVITDVLSFGRDLIRTGDLDPVYITLHNAQLDSDTLDKWLLAYWCFYHCGTASWVVDQPDYWEAMLTAAGSKDYPRATERRHFRAAIALKSVNWLSIYLGGLPDGMLSGLREGIQPKSLRAVMYYVMSWRGFGPWIAFKVADMAERILGVQIDFSSASLFLFSSPRKGAIEVAKEYGIGPSQAPRWALQYIKEELKELSAPPYYDRPINEQEAETILCKYHSYLKGKYYVGKDWEEVKHALHYFNTPTARKLLRGVPCQ